MGDHTEIDHYTLEQLKAEAIKWVKELQSRCFLGDEPRILTATATELKHWYDVMFESGKIAGKIEVLMRFFNLTEDDLK